MSAGYRRLLLPQHPLADKHGMVVEHRLVASEKLGRLLTSEDHVHHINGDRSDNRPENLAVMSRAEHGRLHGRQQRAPKRQRRTRVPQNLPDAELVTAYVGMSVDFAADILGIPVCTAYRWVHCGKLWKLAGIKGNTMIVSGESVRRIQAERATHRGGAAQ